MRVIRPNGTAARLMKFHSVVRIPSMKSITALLAAAAIASLSSCITRRSDFTPENSQPTVGMPAKLSDRERSFISTLDGSLRNEGYLPVRHGVGDMQLEFEIAEGPINTDTTIELHEGRRLIAKGFGRAAGAPMIGRAKVADKSFNRAYEEFQSSLPSGDSHGGSRSHDVPIPDGDQEYVY